MKRTLQLFWSKGWDNLIHLVIVNLIWFTAAIPLALGVVNLVRPYLPEETAAVDAGTDEDAGAETTETATQNGLSPAPPAQPTESAVEAPGAPGVSEPPSAVRLTASIVFVVLSWVLFCIACGFVFFCMADIVKEYDFSGYRYVLREFLRARPLAASVASMTLFTVTVGAALFNLFFYLYLARTRGVIFLLVAALMLWFFLLVSMSFALTLPLIAQRNLRLFRAIRTAAVLSLSAPIRTLIVVLAAAAIFIMSLFGPQIGFFAIAVPAVLLNSDVRARLEEIEQPTTENNAE
ncbi:MAG: YesL family protein [Planctomycetota bacterium]|jgi:hypothetical protein